METMYEEKLEQTLQAILENVDLAEYTDGLDDVEVGIERIDTYERAGLMTNNKGLVLTMKDGTEFQLQIVQSK